MLFIMTGLMVCYCRRHAMVLCSLSTDLASMMIQCSDLSASAKMARSFAKKSTVNEVQRSKPTPTVTYTESRSARQWSSDQSESLTQLFTLPGTHLIMNSTCFNAVCYLRVVAVFRLGNGSPSATNVVLVVALLFVVITFSIC